MDNNNQATYHVISTNTENEFLLLSEYLSSNGYMFSFALANRYVGEVTIRIHKSSSSGYVTAALFGTDTEAITPISSSNTLDVYTVNVSSDLNSFILKVHNAPGTSDRSIKVELVDFQGITGIFENNENNVESFSFKAMAGNYLKTFVRGIGFNGTLENQKMDAQVPPDGRASMRAAATEEPTKNVVFDINF
jgi:hypothetical protein